MESIEGIHIYHFCIFNNNSALKLFDQQFIDFFNLKKVYETYLISDILVNLYDMQSI